MNLNAVRPANGSINTRGMSTTRCTSQWPVKRRVCSDSVIVDTVHKSLTNGTDEDSAADHIGIFHLTETNLQPIFVSML